MVPRAGRAPLVPLGPHRERRPHDRTRPPERPGPLRHPAPRRPRRRATRPMTHIEPPPTASDEVRTTDGLAQSGPLGALAAEPTTAAHCFDPSPAPHMWHTVLPTQKNLRSLIV